MGVLDRIRKRIKKVEKDKPMKEKAPPEPKEKDKPFSVCSYCGEEGAYKKWGGSLWHKKCYRKVRKNPLRNL